MSSILNSISSGLLVQKAPRVKPVKEDFITELLNNSEIEFDTCPKFKDKLDDFNTGFGELNDLHFETKCKLPELKTPLYLENYLKEFKTEEEKAEARHALGLYNKGDIVGMSLLTAEDKLPTDQEWKEFTAKLLRKGDEFFSPITSFNTIYDSDGKTLETRFSNILALVTLLQKEIIKINSITKGKEINSLGDVKVFLQGFSNGNVLKNILDNMNQEMLRFEKTGLITSDY